ncbi:MAG: hypothetical protein RL173_124 [Fibrobacterota bacterium]|jgi:hypothetical protein
MGDTDWGAKVDSMPGPNFYIATDLEVLRQCKELERLTIS